MLSLENVVSSVSASVIFVSSDRQTVIICGQCLETYLILTFKKENFEILNCQYKMYEFYNFFWDPR